MGAAMPQQVDYAIDDLMTLDEASQRWPRFSKGRLLKAARQNDLPNVRLGRTRYVTESFMKLWMAKHTLGAPTWSSSNEASSKSEDTGSIESQVPPPTTGSGMTDEQEKFAAEALRRQISSKPGSRSPRSSPKA